MKVLKKGKGWTATKTCKGCSSVLEIEETDITYELDASDIANQQYEMDIEGRFVVECPECSQKIVFRPKDIPEKVKLNIRG